MHVLLSYAMIGLFASTVLWMSGRIDARHFWRVLILWPLLIFVAKPGH